MSEAPGRMILRNGRPCLFFSGYSYLGMSHVPAFTELVKEGIDRYGILFPSSRISNTPLALYRQLEQYLSQLTGSAATVTFGSGYMACQAVGQLLGKDALVAPGKHPATGLEGGVGSNRQWCLDVVRLAHSAPQDHLVLVMDSVDPLRGVVHDFVFLQDLPRNKHFTVLIDDSHGIGWMGDHGEGISASLMHLPHVEYILVYSLSKALHVQGGAVSCSSALADRLRKSPFYTAATPMAPAFAHALLQGGSLYEVQRARLAYNKEYLTGASSSSGLTPTSLPVFLCEKPGLGVFLEGKDILISSFAYPDPDGAPLERVVVSALHRPEDLDVLIHACNVFADLVTNN